MYRRIPDVKNFYITKQVCTRFRRFENLGKYTKDLGHKALLILSESSFERNQEAIEKAYEIDDVAYVTDFFNGECTTAEIERLQDITKEKECDVLIAIGGGKTIDTAKAVGYYTELPIIICPTAIGTDAPTSALSVVYTEDGEIEEYLFLKQNPDMVVMDSKVLAAAPVKFAISGMGDALATYFEARANSKANHDNFAGGKNTLVANAITKLCYDTLMAEGYKAKVALENQLVTESVERIIEANTLMSGLGFESGGISIAHALHNGLTMIPDTHEKLHGEKVAFGVVTQLVFEGVPDEELFEVLNFLEVVGLPMTLKELGVEDLTDEKINKVIEAAVSEEDTAHNIPMDVTFDNLKAAMLTANAIGLEYLETSQAEG